MNKLLIICGPTAIGKTKIGAVIAHKFSGEIVSADSRQVYKGMDIITGKDLPKNSELIIKNDELRIKNNKLTVGYRLKDGLPIWLVDVVYPDYLFNVGEYERLASTVIENIWSRNKLPIIVGGTGLYIKALIEPLSNIHIPPSINLRERLNKFKIDKLQEELRNINLKRFLKMNHSDRKNPRRLIRAIEITNFLKKHNRSVYRNIYKETDFLLIGLKIRLNLLYESIDKRVEERVKSGVEKELNKLLASGLSWDNTILSTTLGYSEWKDFQEGLISKEVLIQRWKHAEYTFAGRQITWFKKLLQQNQGIWFDVADIHNAQYIEETVRKWYNFHN